MSTNERIDLESWRYTDRGAALGPMGTLLAEGSRVSMRKSPVGGRAREAEVSLYEGSSLGSPETVG